MTAKSLSIKVRGCKSGRCVVKAVELTSGGLRRVLESKTEKAVRPLIPAQKSAEGIVVPPRRDEGLNGPRQGVKGKGK
jgi:hypothetical protein